jgi:PfaD family protein
MRSKAALGSWKGSTQDLKTAPEEILEILQDLSKDCFLVDYQENIAATNTGTLHIGQEIDDSYPAVAYSSALSPSDFGDPAFNKEYGLQAAYMAGSMANAISGVDLVKAMGNAGYLASYGSGGVAPKKLLTAIYSIKDELPSGPYAFNLIHSPNEPALEQKAVDLFLEHQIETIEASAFLRLTPTVVQFRAAGLNIDNTGKVLIKNKIIAKLSRPEVALHFLKPAPDKILSQLVQEGKITAQQAQLAQTIPMADDITVEADSGGHTDNRPLVGLLPSITALRDQVQGQHQFSKRVRIGAGGGISTPASVVAAFSMGAAYVVTGSINQACLEAGTSDHVKHALAMAASPDVMMAPSADMFEMGVKVQVLKRGTMFPMRSQKLYETYLKYDSIEEIPQDERLGLEQKIFQDDLDSIWQECIKFFSERDPDQLKMVERNPKRKMALIFRWYLGLATHWGVQGNSERVLDYQIWCGPSMGAFNAWAKGTELEAVENRKIVELADQLMLGAAYQFRLNQLAMHGVRVPPTWERYFGQK